MKEQFTKLQDVTDKLHPFYDEFKWYQEKQHKEVSGMRLHLSDQIVALNLKVEEQQERNLVMNGKVEKMSVDEKVGRVRQLCVDLIDQTNQQNFAVRNEWNQSLQKLLVYNLNQEKRFEYQSTTNNELYAKFRGVDAVLSEKLNRCEIDKFEEIVSRLPTRFEFEQSIKQAAEQNQ